jgi:hypothetical protein
MRQEGLGIALSDFEVENATMKGDYLWQVVVIVIGGVLTVLEVHHICMFTSHGRMLLQRSIWTNLFGPMRYQDDLPKVDVGIQLLGNIYLVADLILTGVHFGPLLGRRPSFSMCVLVYLSVLHKF